MHLWLEILICTQIKYTSQLKISVRSRTGFRTEKYRNFLYWTSLLKYPPAYPRVIFGQGNPRGFSNSLRNSASQRIVLVMDRRSFQYPRIVLGEHEVEWKTSIKYLVVQLDRRLSFGEHLKIAAAKAIQCGANLARLMPLPQKNS